MKPTVCRSKALSIVVAVATLGGSPNEWAVADDNLSVIAPETPIRASTTGFEPFTAGTTKGGDAFVNIAVDLGRMPSGLDPALRLRYLGSRGHGRHIRHLPGDTLGYGWFLDGVSHVRWCSKDMRPGTTDIKLDGTDSLCVSSHLLVLARGDHLQPGAEYRTALESFERLVVKGGPGASGIWFERILPNGLVAEYGRTPDARHLPGTSTDPKGKLGHAIPLAWSLNRIADQQGNELRYEYHDDETTGVWQLKRVTSGHDQGNEVRLRYATRRDVATSYLGKYARTQRLRLHRVEVYQAGKKAREYRLESSRMESGWERLAAIQLCLFVGEGVESCLAPTRFQWVEPDVELPHVQTLLTGVASPRETVQFTYGMLSSAESNDFVFGADESPYGEFSPSSDLRPAPVSAKGFYKAVVTRLERTAKGEAPEHSSYGYQGGFWDSANNWGAVGFAASRETDETKGTTTYTQYRLDFPHYGKPSAVVVYHGRYRPDARPLSESYMYYDTKTLTHGAARVLLPYTRTTTSMFEEGQLLGVLQASVEEMTVSDNGIETLRQLIEVGLSATPLPTAIWGATRFRLNDVIQSETREGPPFGTN